MKAVILAGGSGTRLFPLSREKFPKQFIKIFGNLSLLQETVLRLTSFVAPSDIVVSTRENYKLTVIDQLSQVNVDSVESKIVLEPYSKNTAPAIALAVKFLLDKEGVDENELVFVAPSDHFIRPRNSLRNYVQEMKDLAKRGFIVTFGITPQRPETGYGYIEMDEPLGNNSYKVKRFTEKPNLEVALEYLNSGNFLWNSGMFAFTVKTFIEELEKYLPEVYDGIFSASFENALRNFYSLPDISIDYGIMEKTHRAAVIKCDFVWSDVGCWDSVYELKEKDENNNVKSGNALLYDTHNCMVLEEDDDHNRIVVTLGVENLLVVGTKDVTLIAKREDSQRVKEVVKELKNSLQFKRFVESSPTEYRPWGSFTELGRGDRYKIKRISVKPGESLSYQMHYHRSEHWIVVKGTAKVRIGDKEIFVHENESVFVPKTTPHSLSNPGKVTLEVIEVQVGEYLGENDIVRFSDKYGRS